MKQENAYIGIDIGTSSVRAVAFDEQGYTLANSSRQCKLITHKPLTAELCPEKIFNDVLLVIKECREKLQTRYMVASIAFSCQMHSLVLVDRNGDNLTNVMTWADNRGVDEFLHIENNVDILRSYWETGCRLEHPMYPVSKILWLKRQNPKIFFKAYKFLTIKEYILYKLYGIFIVDYTLAASQGYFNIKEKKWSTSLLKIIGIQEGQLSNVFDCTHIIRKMKKKYALSLGLNEELPCIIGTGDGIAANLGCGAFDLNTMVTTIGTSGAIRITHNEIILGKQREIWCYNAFENYFTCGGAINNGGIVLSWIEKNIIAPFAKNISIYEWIEKQIATMQIGSEGIIFLPHLLGERSPDWDAKASGFIQNLKYQHTIHNIVRAAMEGVIYQMYAVYEVITSLVNSPSKIIACGGYTRSPLWLQIQADLFQKEIFISNVQEASALGAVFLAMKALNKRKNGEKLPIMESSEKIKPIEANYSLYRESYKQARGIYKHNKKRKEL